MSIHRLISPFLTIVLTAALCIPTASAQTSFKLKKEKGHYYLTTTVNGNPDIKVLVGTGARVNIGETDFEKMMKDEPYDTIPYDKKNLRAETDEYNIKKVVEGTITFGDLSYTGRIFVLEDFDKITMPVHLLKNEADSTANLICFNFKENTLGFIKRDAVDTDKMYSFNIVKYSPIPTFETTMELSDTYGNDCDISGNMQFNIASGTPVFLFRKNVARQLKNAGIRVFPSYDKSSGEVVGEGIFAQYCKIGELTMKGASIGITNKMWFKDAFGCVGPALFGKNDVIIDPVHNKIFYSK